MKHVLTKSINIDAGILTTVVFFGGYRTANAGDEEQNVVKLTGVVRDFHERSHAKGHPDFEKRPDHGFGLYCGNVGLYLGEDGKPVFTGAGRKVSTQAFDAEGRPIAPHLANRQFSATGEGDSGLDLPEACATLQDSKDVDAYEVCLVSVNNNADGTSSWTYHVREIGGKDLSHWNLKLDPSHQVVDGTTPGYDFGVDGSTGYFGIKWDVEDSFSEGDFTIVLDGQYEGDMDSEGVLAKGGKKASDAKMMFVPTTSAWPTTPGLVADGSLGDEEASMSYSDTGAIDSDESFRQWYRDTMGVNVSRPLELTFVEQEDGSYVFDDKLDPLFIDRGGFFPVDGSLFGNSGGDGPDHNYHFTFELNSRFTYDADGDQFFRFIGDDDVWVFIDGKLAIDLGGVHAATEQMVDLTRMGLEDGETYTIDFFFAERHRTQSNFRIETNLDMECTKKTPSMTAAFD